MLHQDQDVRDAPLHDRPHVLAEAPLHVPEPAARQRGEREAVAEAEAVQVDEVEPQRVHGCGSVVYILQFIF